MTESKSPKPVRYMDFVGGRRAASTDPLISRPASRAAKKPVARPASAPKSAQKPAKPAPKPASKTAVAVSKEAKAFVSRQPATSRDLYPTQKPATKSATAKPSALAPKSTQKPASKTTDQPKDAVARKASAALSGSAKNSSDDAPDNNAYVLGGRSPFLPSYSVDKRPLSSSVKPKETNNFEKLSYLGVSDASSEKPRKNVYEKTPEIELSSADAHKKSKKKSKTVKIIDDSDKKSGLPLVIIILLTIILGAAVGAGVYFLLPK